MGERLSFVVQDRQEGLGHAIWCARDWIGREPFLVVLGDHVFVSTSGQRCAAQLVGAFSGQSITALAVVGEEELPGFGVARGRMSAERPGLLHVEGFAEKPDAEVARAQYSVEGVPEGKYLAHFGMHLFTPAMLEVLGEMIATGRRGGAEYQLTAAQDILCNREPYMGLVVEGMRYDMGTPAGMIGAQMALALAGDLGAEAERLWRDALRGLRG
jgi:UTP--glucose-1-phosphate uridylyltransferase